MNKILLELVNRGNIELLDSEAIHHSSGWRRIGWGYRRVQKRETTWRTIYDYNGITWVTVFFVITLTEVLFLRSLLESIHLLCSAQHLIWIQILLQKQFWFFLNREENSVLWSQIHDAQNKKKIYERLAFLLKFSTEKT